MQWYVCRETTASTHVLVGEGCLNVFSQFKLKVQFGFNQNECFFLILYIYFFFLNITKDVNVVFKPNAYLKYFFDTVLSPVLKVYMYLFYKKSVVAI